MRAGTLIRVPDGRVGRVVYNGLDGVGIKFGADSVDVEIIMRGDSGLFNSSPDDQELRRWQPDAMLRDPWPTADESMEYVGEHYELVHEEDKS